MSGMKIVDLNRSYAQLEHGVFAVAKNMGLLLAQQHVNTTFNPLSFDPCGSEVLPFNQIILLTFSALLSLMQCVATHQRLPTVWEFYTEPYLL